MELGKLAQQKSRNDAVTAFAKRMVDDHGKSNAQLAELAKQAGLLLPNEPAPDQLEVKQRTSGALNGTAFNVEYTPALSQKTVQLLLWVIASGQNADLQRFASGALPDIVHHLQLAQRLLSRLAVQPRPRRMTRGCSKGGRETSLRREHDPPEGAFEGTFVQDRCNLGGDPLVTLGPKPTPVGLKRLASPARRLP